MGLQLVKYVRIIGSLILVILTLGAYARYQANKAKFAQRKAQEANNALNQANKLIDKRNRADKENAESIKDAMDKASDRTYFDEYGDGRLSNIDTLPSKR